MVTGVQERVLVDKFQKQFTRMISGKKGCDYPSMLRRLGLWTLEERRNRADLILLYKMMNGLAAPAFDQFFEISEEKRTRGHSRKLVKNRCRLDLRKQFFSERVVSTWNGLGEDVVSAGSVNIFVQSCGSAVLRVHVCCGSHVQKTATGAGQSSAR